MASLPAGTRTLSSVTDATAPSRSADHRRRDQLLEAAIEQIHAVGPGVSMEQIAAAAGVTKPTIYRAFGSKNGLYQAVVDWFVSILQADILGRLDASGPLRPFIRSVILIVLQRIDEHEPVYHFMMRRARMELSPNEHEPDFLTTLGDTAQYLIVQRMEEIGFDTRPTRLYGHAIVGLVSAAADWWLDDRGADLEQVAEDLTDLLYDGFRVYDLSADVSVRRPLPRT